MNNETEKSIYKMLIKMSERTSDIEIAQDSVMSKCLDIQDQLYANEDKLDNVLDWFEKKEIWNKSYPLDKKY